MRRTSILGVLIALHALGCGGSSAATPDAAEDAPSEDAPSELPDGESPDGDPPEGPDAGMTAEELIEAQVCRPVAEATCARADTCGCGPFPRGEAECVTRTIGRCLDELTLVSEGNLGFARPELAPDCVRGALARAENCQAVWFHEPQACFDMIGLEESVGTPPCTGGDCTRRDVGATCSGIYDCKGGDACVDGHCAHRHGDPCSAAFTDACGGDAECAGALSYTCQAKIPLGGACSPELPQVFNCVDGAHCDEETLVCTPSPAIGEPCLPYMTSCAEGAACAWNLECIPLPGRGEDCAYGRDETAWFTYVCAEGLACVGGTCTDPPTLGAPCGDGEECGEGLACLYRYEASMCAELQGEGEPCPGPICRSGLYCDPHSETCLPQAGSGQPCARNEECGPDLTCQEVEEGRGACLPERKKGEQCYWEGHQCEDGAYCHFEILEGRCESTFCELLGLGFSGTEMDYGPPR